MTPEELKKRTADLAAEVVLFAEPVFREAHLRGAAGQLCDAATSVAANYRVACRARSRAEFAAKIGIALEEADETTYWLEHLMRVAPSIRPRAQRLHREADEIVAILSASYYTVTGRRPRKPRRRPPTPDPGSGRNDGSASA